MLLAIVGVFDIVELGDTSNIIPNGVAENLLGGPLLGGLEFLASVLLYFAVKRRVCRILGVLLAVGYLGFLIR